MSLKAAVFGQPRDSSLTAERLITDYYLLSFLTCNLIQLISLQKVLGLPLFPCLSAEYYKYAVTVSFLVQFKSLCFLHCRYWIVVLYYQLFNKRDNQIKETWIRCSVRLMPWLLNSSWEEGSRISSLVRRRITALQRIPVFVPRNQLAVPVLLL